MKGQKTGSMLTACFLTGHGGTKTKCDWQSPYQRQDGRVFLQYNPFNAFPVDFKYSVVRLLVPFQVRFWKQVVAIAMSRIYTCCGIPW